LKSGQSTGFVENIERLFIPEGKKIHTLRSNYHQRLEKTYVKENNDLNLENTIHFKIDRNIKTTVEFALTYEGAEILSQLLMKTLLNKNQKNYPDEK